GGRLAGLTTGAGGPRVGGHLPGAAALCRACDGPPPGAPLATAGGRLETGRGGTYGAQRLPRRGFRRGVRRAPPRAGAGVRGRLRRIPREARRGAGRRPGDAPPPEARVTTLARLRRATTKLSKLQRSLLHFARDYDGDWRGAPMSLMRAETPSDAAALSRALRRLEGRKLLSVQRTAGGRATYIRLTPDGRNVTEKR